MQLPKSLGRVHIIGIGGIGMSAIAELLHATGFAVQGSDQKDSANVRRLIEHGIKVFVGHDASNLAQAEFVVISTAVKDANPELQAARDRGLTIIRRAEMLAELMRLYATVSVTGTHGKTTTTSLIAHIFQVAGLDPTVITGGIINDWNSNARLGDGKWMIVEADESDGTFVKIPTQIGVVTNIDPEHLDYFGSVENMHVEYAAFMRKIPFYGLLMACTDQQVVRDMVERLELRRDGRRFISYGRTPDADVVLGETEVVGNQTYFSADLGVRVAGGARRIERWMVPIPGAHNALNALAATAVAAEAGLDDGTIRDALAGFLRRQAALPVDRYGWRRRHLRRLRPSPDRDQGRVGGGQSGRSRAADRRRRAPSVLACARPVPGFLQLPRRCRQRVRHAALFGRRNADRRHQQRVPGCRNSCDRTWLGRDGRKPG